MGEARAEGERVVAAAAGEAGDVLAVEVEVREQALSTNRRRKAIEGAS